MGIELLAVTGRSDILTKDYIEELGINIPVVGCNGASLSNVITGEVMYIHPINKSAVKAVISACIKAGIPCKAFSMDTVFSSDREMLDKGIKQIVTKYTKELKYMIKGQWLSDEDMLKMAETEDILKVVTINNDIDRLRAIQRDLNNVDCLQVIKSNINCLDMIAESVSKGSALAEYAKSKGISMEQCIAFGDNENDIPMITAAGLGIAMANADESVRKSADRVALTNDECGVAVELEKIFKFNV
jgi:Cof subfamily protein (haloacid dehalogenase superfamily)